jgi:zinc transport system ATP-binding protein
MVTSTDQEVALSLDGVSARLGTHTALEDISVEIPVGSYTVVLGPNGGGKTTLLRLLMGLIQPSVGEIAILGKTPNQLDYSAFGYVPQLKTQDRRFPGIALELVATGLLGYWPFWLGRDTRHKSLEALERVGVGHLAKRRLKELSGGEMQRLFLARALVRRPQFILLDEPATGIDRTGTIDMYDSLEAYRRETNCTVVMVTHDWSAAYHHSTHVMVIARQLIGFGPPAEVLTDDILNEAFGHLGHKHAPSFAPGTSGERAHNHGGGCSHA